MVMDRFAILPYSLQIDRHRYEWTESSFIFLLKNYTTRFKCNSLSVSVWLYVYRYRSIVFFIRDKSIQKSHKSPPRTTINTHWDYGGQSPLFNSGTNHATTNNLLSCLISTMPKYNIAIQTCLPTNYLFVSVSVCKIFLFIAYSLFAIRYSVFSIVCCVYVCRLAIKWVCLACWRFDGFPIFMVRGVSFGPGIFLQFSFDFGVLWKVIALPSTLTKQNLNNNTHHFLYTYLYIIYI